MYVYTLLTQFFFVLNTFGASDLWEKCHTQLHGMIPYGVQYDKCDIIRDFIPAVAVELVLRHFQSQRLEHGSVQCMPDHH